MLWPIAVLRDWTVRQRCSNHFRDTPKGISAPYSVYRAAYAYQALLSPGDENLWQTTIRRTGKAFQGMSGLMNAVKGLELDEFIDRLNAIQQGFSGNIDKANVKAVQIGIASSANVGQDFVEILVGELHKPLFNQKSAWYPAL